MRAQGFRKDTLSTTELQRRDEILLAVPSMIASAGFAACSLPFIADGLGLPVSLLRKLFADRDEVLYLVIRDHLQRIATEFRTVPEGSPEARRLLRAAYHRVAHVHDGGPLTDAHAIMLEERNRLPEELLGNVYAMWKGLLGQLAPFHMVDLVKSMLDGPFTAIAHIEALLGGRPEEIRPEEEDAAAPPALAAPAPQPACDGPAPAGRPAGAQAQSKARSQASPHSGPHSGKPPRAARPGAAKAKPARARPALHAGGHAARRMARDGP